MYYIIRVWDGDKLQYEQEFPPELEDNEAKARKNFDRMKKLWPECEVKFISQPTLIYQSISIYE